MSRMMIAWLVLLGAVLLAGGLVALLVRLTPRSKREERVAKAAMLALVMLMFLTLPILAL